MKILLTGATGQVGWELQRALMPLGEVIALTRKDADLADPESLRQAVRSLKPDVVVNPAAYTAVDKAESEQELAMLINAKAPGVLAEEVAKLNGLLVHYSTDYVFDGSKLAAYTENDVTNPMNSYGLSKLAGEAAIQATDCQHLILRTSWVYAARGHNFLKTILRLAAERDELSIVADQIGSPTWARLIAESTAQILRSAMLARQDGQASAAVYNLTSTGETSWHGFAQAIVEIAQQNGLLPEKPLVIKPIPSSAYPVPAKRPANSRLAVEKLEREFGLQLPSWRDALALCMADLR